MILLYHLIFPDDTPACNWNAGKIIRLSAFRRPLRWLKKRFAFLSLEEYLQVWKETKSQKKRYAVLTFDDGYARTFALTAPVLQEEKVPATFFANTRNLDGKHLLWFVYFNALCSEQVYPRVKINGLTIPLDTEKNSLFAWRMLIRLARASTDARAFAEEYAQKYPLPEKTREKYAGLTSKQLAEIGGSPLFSLGGHTHSHPYLDQISFSEQTKEMSLNKNVLESLSGKPVPFFAYPGGVYNKDSIDAVHQVGFRAALAVSPKFLSSDLMDEIPRTDVYSPAIWKLQLKTLGVVRFFRKGRM